MGGSGALVPRIRDVVQVKQVLVFALCGVQVVVQRNTMTMRHHVRKVGADIRDGPVYIGDHGRSLLALPNRPYQRCGHTWKYP